MGFKDSPIIFLARKTWEYSKGNRGNVVFYFILFVISNSFSFMEPLLLAYLLNIIQLEGVVAGNIGFLLFVLAGYIILRLATWIFHGPARVMERKNAFFAKVRYKQFLADGIMGLPADWHVNHHSGDTIDKVEKATTALERFAARGFEVINAFFNLISSYIAITYFNLHAGYIILFIFIISIRSILKFDKTLKKKYKELFLAENKVSAKVYDIISNITTVIILRVESLLSKDLAKKLMSPFKVFYSAAKLNEVKWFTVSMLGGSMYFLVIASYILGNYWAGEVILVGTISALASYIRRINTVFNKFAYQYGEIVRQKAAVENMEEVSVLFKEKEKSQSINLQKSWKEWKIENLSFSYHGKDSGDLHLNNISLSIKRNEKVALIGESGSGKTTFLKLMRGLYRPKHVEMHIDQTKVKQGFDTLSKNISLIPQEPEIFETTVKENITMGIAHKKEYIKRFTDMACFTKVIKRLPKGLNSSVVEKGVNLSGGEKQRLALSRGLLASVDKPIILLDEPTSSVDTKNELTIYENIFRKYKKKTIVATIHRLHLLEQFDKVYMFHKGKLVASGTLKQLKKESKTFQRLWKKYQREKKTKK